MHCFLKYSVILRSRQYWKGTHFHDIFCACGYQLLQMLMDMQPKGRTSGNTVSESIVTHNALLEPPLNLVLSFNLSATGHFFNKSFLSGFVTQ